MLGDFSCLATICLPAFLSSTEGLLTTGASLSLAVFSVWKIRHKNTVRRTFWMYVHLFALSFPIFYFLFSLKCGSATWCNSVALLLALPISVLGAIGLGYFVVPWMYQLSLKTTEITSGKLYQKIQKQAMAENLPMPKIFLIDDVQPLAFTSTPLQPKLFFSVGLLELLSIKEFEAVVLHELYHLKTKTPRLKSLGLLLKKVSPIFAFGGIYSVLKHEEIKADYFAIEKQSTAKYLHRAKLKLNKFTQTAEKE